jgi:hypothetical protein
VKKEKGKIFGGRGRGWKKISECLLAEVLSPGTTFARWIGCGCRMLERGKKGKKALLGQFPLRLLWTKKERH